MKRKLDVGCGRNKMQDAVGIDIYEFPGVDVVHDLEQFPWPFESDAFDYIKITHVIEHINDQVGFFKEIHRIAARDAIIHLETPHFSSRDSWADPTHVRHMSLFFTDPFCGDNYLGHITGKYALVSRRVNFGSIIGSFRARLTVKLFGYEKWERKAFKMPARNIYVDLKVIK